MVPQTDPSRNAERCFALLDSSKISLQKASELLEKKEVRKLQSVYDEHLIMLDESQPSYEHGN